MNQIPYFEIGAARSGTKTLRDTLAVHPEIETSDYPYEDEIWQYGQNDAPHDAYPPGSLTGEIKRHIRSQFEKKMVPGKQFFEKNNRHCMRIPYIRAIYPETKFVHIIRDGRDAVLSTRKMRDQPFDWNYYLSSRIFNVSPKGLYLWGKRRAMQYVKRLIHGPDSADLWGVDIPDLDRMVQEKSPLQICAQLWRYPVKKACEDGRNLPGDRYLEIRYESLMRRPAETLSELGDFLGIDPDPMIDYGRETFRDSSIGKWEEELDDTEKDVLIEEIGDLLEYLNYE